MLKRRLLLSAGTVGVAAVIGFLAGQVRHPAAASPPGSLNAVLTNAPTPPATPPLPASIDVSSGALGNMNLHFAKAAFAPLVRTIQVTGTVGFDQLRVAQITPPARGRVEAIEAVVGEHVTAGQQLAVLDNFDLSGARSGVASAQAQVAQAQAQATTAQAALVRALDLVRSGGMAQSELDSRRADVASAQAQLQTRQAELRQWQDTEQRLMPIAPGNGAGSTNPVSGDPRDSEGAIISPFNGVVDAVAVSAGEIVDESRQMFTVADLSKVWVQVQVPERDLGSVQVGDAVTIQDDAYPGRNFIGQVSYIADQVDPNTGTVAVRCEVPNPDEALRVNMFVTAGIASPLNRDAVLVPNAALQDVNGQSAVFSPDGGGRFTWHAVQTGISSNGFTDIISGIAAGTPVVTTGSYWLKATLLAQTIPSE
jgi:cobalt-zinc-cadmium efflux system membrane fusion protein